MRRSPLFYRRNYGGVFADVGAEEADFDGCSAEDDCGYCVGLGGIGADSIAVPALIDKRSPFFVVSGLSLALFFWFVAVFISREI